MAGEWFERNDHPFFNDVILSKVFECVRPTDLKECRVVSKKWNVSTIPFTRKTWTVKIFGNEPGVLEFMSINKKLLDARRIGKFIEVFSLNQLGIPFARFQLGAFSMTDVLGQQFLRLCGEIAMEIDMSLEVSFRFGFRLGAFGMTDVVGQQFLKLCGEIAKEIDLGLESLDDQDFMVEDLSELTPNLVKFVIPIRLRSSSSNIVKLFPGPENSKPKLQFLRKLKSCYDYPETRNKFCPSFMEELFTAADNISNVSSGDSTYDGIGNGVTKCTSLEILTIIEKLGRESCIETLQLSEVGEEHVEILRRMKSNRMKLKKMNGLRTSERISQVATMFEIHLKASQPNLIQVHGIGIQ